MALRSVQTAAAERAKKGKFIHIQYSLYPCKFLHIMKENYAPSALLIKGLMRDTMHKETMKDEHEE